MGLFQWLGFKTGKKWSKLTAGECYDILSKKYGFVLDQLKILDTEYNVPYRSDVWKLRRDFKLPPVNKEMLKRTSFDSTTDCDDFAAEFWLKCRRRRWAAVLVVDRRNRHSVVAVLTDKGPVVVDNNKQGLDSGPHSYKFGLM